MTLSALRASELVLGFDDPHLHPTWDAVWREKLVDNLGALERQLRSIGITEIFINGSFVEDKDHPNDIDGYFECELRYFASGELQRDLNLLDPHKIWTWDPSSRRAHPGFPKRQLPMWHQYRVELYPDVGYPSGIVDWRGKSLTFPQAFRQRRGDGEAKGIIKLVD